MTDVENDDFFLIRRGSPDKWAALNPVLRSGEIAFEKITYRLKVGDGVTEWIDLPYITVDPGDVPGLTDDLQGKLSKAANLSDLASVLTARTNLGLGTAATKNTGTAAGEVVLGDDIRLTNNRAPTAHNHVAGDVSDSTVIGRSVFTAADASTARSVIGAGTSSLVIGITAGTAAEGTDSRIIGAAQKVSNLSDLSSISAARTNLGLGTAVTAYARRVGFAGDSITDGAGTTAVTYSFINQAARIAGSARVTVTNEAGVPGERSDQLLTRIPAILTSGIDHLHIQIGTNDAGQLVAPATFQANVAAIVTLARNAGVTVSAGLVPPRGSGSATTIHTLIGQYNLWLRVWCPKQGIPLADTFTPLVDPVTGYITAANDSGDGTHPSNAGHLAMARAVAPVIAGPQLAMPWPVTSVQAAGLISNPLMSSTTGWSDRGGTASSMTVSTAAAVPGDGLPAGAWLTMRINNTAGGSSVYRQRAHTIDAAKYTAGDILAVFAIADHSDITAAASLKLQITNADVSFREPLNTGNSVHNPGPVLATFTVPASGTLRVGAVLTAPAGRDVTARIGAVQVYNLTTGALNGLV